MFPNFAALPPEVNAATLTTGPGPGSTRDAAEAWHDLSSQLHHACVDMNRALKTLTGAWQSPAAIQMMKAAAAYLFWLRGDAYHAREIGVQAYWRAAAFEEAVTSMVPLETIAATTDHITKLANDNTFGQYTAQIGRFETLYQEYWITNARAMDHYADTITKDGPVKPFAQAPQIINEQGLANVAEAWLSQQQG